MRIGVLDSGIRRRAHSKGLRGAYKVLDRRKYVGRCRVLVVDYVLGGDVCVLVAVGEAPSKTMTARHKAGHR